MDFKDYIILFEGFDNVGSSFVFTVDFQCFQTVLAHVQHLTNVYEKWFYTRAAGKLQIFKLMILL